MAIDQLPSFVFLPHFLTFMTLRTFQNFPFSAELGFLGPFSSVSWPQALALAASRALGLGLPDFPRFSRTLQIWSPLS